MSIGSDSQSNSQYLSSSQSSLSRSKKTSPELSKTYKHASQLYLTRRLAEAYGALQPVITPPSKSNGSQHSEDEAVVLAPIATATTSQRIKIWSLYIVLLNAIVDLDGDDGRRDFGPREFKSLVSLVKDGGVWEQVVRDGYGGRESSVDAEVVYNLSNLLLGQASSQKLNQSRLETYLSSSPPPLDITDHLNRSFAGHAGAQMNGTSTPKDLTSRLKILELFTLHVLPKNDEWDYARSFISNSDILDEERREAFLQTLQELQDVKDEESVDGDVFEESAEEFQPDQADAIPEPLPSNPFPADANGVSHRRTSSEVDYGIDKSHPNGSTTSTAKAAESVVPAQQPRKPSFAAPSTSPKPTSPSSEQIPRSSHLSPPSQTPRNRGNANRKPSSKQNDSLLTQARALFRALQNLASKIAGGITGNPTLLFRMLLFIIALVMVGGRPEVRERVRRVLGTGWGKVKGTVGMGVKVSYI